MGESMIERVATALAMVDGEVTDYHRELALAAIKSMYEPTDEMLHAASGSTPGAFSFEERRIDWRAMIAAALGE
jgi:flagellar biosynthesis regulator FlbT